MKLAEARFSFSSVLEWEDHKVEFTKRLRAAATLQIPHLRPLAAHEGVCAIVGAGPSLSEDPQQVAFIRALKAKPYNVVMALNGAHEWLLTQGIVPNIHVMAEHDLEHAGASLGGSPHDAVTYYVCSSCNEHVHDQLDGYQRVLWHFAYPWEQYQQSVADLYPGECLVACGHATFFKTLAIGSILGYREFEIFGVDSSFEASSHLAGYQMADIEPKIQIWAVEPDGEAKEFTTQGGLAFQAKEFLEVCKAYHPELRMKVHGDGMLRYLHQSRYPELYKE